MTTIKQTIKDSMIITNPTAFYIYDKKGRVRKDIKRAFLKSFTVNSLNILTGDLRIEDAYWKIKCSLKTKEAIELSFCGLPCIISFQELKDGNRIAIVRLLKDA